MKRLVFLYVIVSGLSVAAGTQQISATSVTWKEVFGYSSAEPNTTFCLMANGACGPGGKNVQSVTEKWLTKHPDAQIIPVCNVRCSRREPQALLTFVWVVDGDESLNLELVRQGCFPFLTQTISEKALQVPKTDYIAFMKKAVRAGIYASEHKLGLFSNP